MQRGVWLWGVGCVEESPRTGIIITGQNRSKKKTDYTICTDQIFMATANDIQQTFNQ